MNQQICIFLGQYEVDKPMVIELAVAAMEELIRMAQLGDPLWLPGLEILCEDEYVRTFPREIGPKSFGLKSVTSRENVVVIMNHINLVEILMDVNICQNQWSTVFSGIVSRALTLEVLSTGVAGNYNGALQVMSELVEYHCFIGGLSWSTSDSGLKRAFKSFAILLKPRSHFTDRRFCGGSDA